MKNNTFIFEPTNWKTKYDFERGTPEKKDKTKPKYKKKKKKKTKSKTKNERKEKRD